MSLLGKGLIGGPPRIFVSDIVIKEGSISLINLITNMIHGNFIGAAIVSVIYTVYVLLNPSATKSKTAFIVILVALNALTIILMSFAFK